MDMTIMALVIGCGTSFSLVQLLTAHTPNRHQQNDGQIGASQSGLLLYLFVLYPQMVTVNTPMFFREERLAGQPEANTCRCSYL